MSCLFMLLNASFDIPTSCRYDEAAMTRYPAEVREVVKYALNKDWRWGNCVRTGTKSPISPHPPRSGRRGGGAG